MNCCKEIDKYISLYLDELLDDKDRTEFLKHIDECSQCSAKLKAESYVFDLCRENQDIELPENFSSSLHERLSEINQNESKNKILTFIYNKRFIASLSTAAILVVSLLAYRLLPPMRSDSTSMAADTVQIEASSAANGDSGSSENKSTIRSNDTANSTSQNNATADSASSNTMVDGDISKDTAVITKADNKVTTPKVTVKFNKSVSAEDTKTSEQSIESQKNVVTNSSNKESEEKLGVDASCFTLTSESKADTNKYFSNYAESNLIVSSERLEIENLRKLMKEIGAIELKPVTINSVNENLVADSTTENNVKASEESPEYIDYYLPLSLYSTLESQATKYTLELSTKTDIIKTDITDKYNVLNTQKSEIDKKIADAVIIGADKSDIEAEKTRITEEMNKLISEKEMITVRVFYVYK